MIDLIAITSTVLIHLKPFIPNIIGGVLALWDFNDTYKKEDSKRIIGIRYLIVLPFLFTFAVFFGYYIGGTIAEIANIKPAVEGVFTFTYSIIMILSTASSLKFGRKFRSYLERIMDLVFDSLLNKIKAFLGVNTTKNEGDNNESK